MSKANDTSDFGRATQVRELGDDELENVSGGRNFGTGVFGAIIVYDYEGMPVRGGTSKSGF